VLDIGARDGHFSKLLTAYFSRVTALDLKRPSFEHPAVVAVAGDVTRLDFPDETFDCVFCAEVLEHVARVEEACREIRRVAKHEVVIGVPFKQDTRIGRTTCKCCQMINPPWGHVNSFDESRLCQLFAGLRPISTSFVGLNREATNSISCALMDWAGNPWGTYAQEEPCIHCGCALIPPALGSRSFRQRVCSYVAHGINRLQSPFVRSHGNWIHIVFSKDSDPKLRGE